MEQDYKTIDTTDPKLREDKKAILQKHIKRIVSMFIFIPLIFLILIAFILKINIPESVYIGMAIFYLVLFITIAIISIIIPHT